MANTNERKDPVRPNIETSNKRGMNAVDDGVPVGQSEEIEKKASLDEPEEEETREPKPGKVPRTPTKKEAEEHVPHAPGVP